MWNNPSQGVKEVSQIYLENPNMRPVFIWVQQIKDNESFYMKSLCIRFFPFQNWVQIC